MTGQASFHFAGHVLDLRRGNLSRDGREIVLRPKSFALLRYLVEHAGRLVSRDELFETLWPNVIVSENSLTRCVAEIRRALADDAETILKTVPKRGYVLAAPVSSPPAEAIADTRPDEALSDRVIAAAPPAGAAERLDATRATGRPNEIKLVTMLHARLADAPLLVAGLGPEAALARIERPIAAMMGVIRQFDGLVLKALADGVLAVFGAPLARENHAVLACRAALDLVDRIAQLDDAAVRVRVGLHSGRVVVGMAPRDASSAGGYALGGVPVIAVEGLQSLAGPNEIFACAECHRLAEGFVRFDGPVPPPSSGSPGANPAYRVAGLDSRSSWHVRALRPASRFIGRTAEMESLTRAAATAFAGRGQALVIIGEPGVGKSRLVHEFVGTPSVANWCILDIACDPPREGSPDGAVRALVCQCLARLAPQSEPVPAAIDSPAIGLPPLWRSALRAALDLRPADSSWDALEPRQRGRAIADAVCAVCEAALRERPTMLLAEDLHWLAPAAASILARIAGLAARHRALVLFTSRPDPALEWCERAGLTRLHLPPLDEPAGTALATASLGALARSASVKQRLLAHTGGVPLFIEEVCRDLIERHGPAQDWSSATLARLRQDLGVPSTIQGVIAQRIDRLGDGDREVLQLAAVIGSRVPVDLLRQIAGLPDDSLTDRLAGLDSAGLLRERSLLPQHIYEFAHHLTRQVAYESMIEATRLRRHADILTALETTAAEPSQDRSALLCRHAIGAAAWTKARDYATVLARTCLDRSAFADAAQYFEAAFDAVDRLPHGLERERNAIDLRIEARLAYSGAGRLDRRIDLSAEAERRAEAIGDERRHIAAMTVTAAMVTFTGVPADAIARGGEVLRRAELLGDPGWIVSAEYALGLTRLTAGHWRDADILVERAFSRLLAPDPAVPPGMSLRLLRLLCCLVKTAAHAELGEPAKAEIFRRYAQEIGAASGRSVERVAAGTCEGLYHLLCADAAEAIRHLTATLALATREDMRLYTPVIRLYLGMAQMRQGRIDEASASLAGALDEAEAIGYAAVALRASLHLGRAQSRRGEFRTGIDRVARVYEAARQQGFEGIETEALFAQGEILAGGSAEDRERAADCLDGSARLAVRLGGQRQAAESVALLHRIGDPAGPIGASSIETFVSQESGCR
jgi:DNA-binding winged helix-turn-helix (wHTH) protein/tetratricopeptide (TPR) repeat protein